MKTTLRLAGLMLAVAAPTLAQGAGLRSTYVETQSCPVVHEGHDEFMRECKGPGNVRAVLHYVEGLFGVYYLPSMGDRQMQREDMLEVKPSARQPFGAKLEWRLRAGSACAAIIRAYTPKGEVLVVHDLASGNRIGLARSNGQARSLADRACNAAPAPVAVAAQTAVAAPQPAIGSDEANAFSAARVKGEGRFEAVYVQTGISGAQEEIEACYAGLAVGAGPEALAECAAFDVRATLVDGAMTSRFPDLAQPFFASGMSEARVAQALERIEPDGGKRADAAAALSAAFDMSISAAAAPSQPAPQDAASAAKPATREAASGSVFDFSE